MVRSCVSVNAVIGVVVGWFAWGSEKVTADSIEGM